VGRNALGAVAQSRAIPRPESRPAGAMNRDQRPWHRHGRENTTSAPHAAGKLPPPLQNVRFLDDKGNDVPQGELGEITVKAPPKQCVLI